MLFLLLTMSLFNLASALGPRPPQQRPEGLQTYTPQGATLDGSDFSHWVSSSASKGPISLGLAQGQYNVVNPNNDAASYIVLEGLVGTTLWMDGVNLTFPDNTITAFTIDSSSNVTTYGPSIWWSTPGFGQATITQSTQQDATTYVVQVECDAGYDCSSMVQNGQLDAEYTDPDTGLLQAGPGWSTFQGAVSSLSDNSWQFTFTDAYFEPLVGYKLLSRGQFLFCNQVTSSNYTSINDFTAFNCGGFFWFSHANIRTAFNSVAIRPAPFPPTGGQALPVRASSADGMHSAGDYIGPQIDSCLFSLLDDDCIAIHGNLGNTSNLAGNTFAGTAPASIGDTLDFYTRSTYAPIGSATVTAVSSSNDGYTITIDSIPSGFGDDTVYSNANQVGSGFSITNTHTTGNRGRGAIIKASDGTIANNVFEFVTYAGIYLGPEAKYWGETDYVHNLKITNNTIRNCSYIDLSVSSFSLHGDDEDVASNDPNLNPINGNSNIVVDGLTISGNGSPSNIYVGAASNVSLANIVIEDALQSCYSINDVTPDALVNFQNVQLSSVDICQQNTGDVSGIADVKIYGTVTGAPSTIPAC